MIQRCLLAGLGSFAQIGKDSSVNVGTQHDGCVGRGLVRRA